MSPFDCKGTHLSEQEVFLWREECPLLIVRGHTGRAEIRNQKSEIRGQRSEIRGQRSEIRFKLSSEVDPILFSAILECTLLMLKHHGYKPCGRTLCLFCGPIMTGCMGGQLT
jgi:hypothetical protein